MWRLMKVDWRQPGQQRESYKWHKINVNCTYSAKIKRILAWICITMEVCSSVSKHLLKAIWYDTIRYDTMDYTPCLKKRPTLACYNFDTHEWILIFFGRKVTDKVDNQKTLHYATSNNLCFCTTWQNAETRKSHISLNWIVLHTQCAIFLNKKVVICDAFNSV